LNRTRRTHRQPPLFFEDASMTSDLYPSPTGQLAAPASGAQLMPYAIPVKPATEVRTDHSGSPSPVSETLHDQPPSIEVVDWDILFDAIETRLREAVGERLGILPNTPMHSAQLSASLVQAVVLDCVDALHKLHAAIKHDRSQRPTP
jgi:hypothetical protein